MYDLAEDIEPAIVVDIGVTQYSIVLCNPPRVIMGNVGISFHYHMSLQSSEISGGGDGGRGSSEDSPEDQELDDCKCDDDEGSVLTA